VDVNTPSREQGVPCLAGEIPPPRDTTVVRALIQRAVRKAGIPARLARDLQITPSHVSRLRRGACGLSVPLVLRLARYLDEDGVAILRLCGHVRIADLFDGIQWDAPQQDLPQHSRDPLHAAIERLSAADRTMVSAFVIRLLGDSRTPPSRASDSHMGSAR
jgi:hypothetical protein